MHPVHDLRRGRRRRPSFPPPDGWRVRRIPWEYLPAAIIVALGLAGLSAGIALPSDLMADHGRALSVVVVAIAALIAGRVALACTRGRDPHGWSWSSRVIRAMAVTVVAGLLFGSPALRMGLPQVLSYGALGHEATITVEVLALDGVRQVGRARDPRPGIRVRGDGFGGRQGSHLFAVPDPVRRGLRPGDRLVLRGKRTPLGFIYTTIARPPG